MSSSGRVWSKIFRTKGVSPVFVEVGIGDGQRGVASFVWQRDERPDEQWDDVIPEDHVLQVDLRRGDRVPFSVLSCVVLVKRVNPYTPRMSVDVTVYQKGRRREAAAKLLRFANSDSEAIVAFSFRLTFRAAAP
jgi:hypothetical protein